MCTMTLFSILQDCFVMFLLQESADHPVWANKIYKSKPMLVKEDRDILKHRRWFAQFYSENSPRYYPKTSLDW